MAFLKVSQNSPVPVSFLIIKFQADACDIIKKETLTQVLLCEFCEFFRNTFLTEHAWTTASETQMNAFFTEL